MCKEKPFELVKAIDNTKALVAKCKEKSIEAQKEAEKLNSYNSYKITLVYLILPQCSKCTLL